ncbi:MAG: 4Fe-4S binding protein [Desulfatitalea sp.]|nr:4Fe-4S binding protein [Desulfatitalea sp.]NNK02212.1 4Fe-4S binding protein [Desulfatitalea sp.]
MPIERIDSDKCTGCGNCVRACTVDVIRMDKETNKAVIMYPQECMVCDYCELDCPEDAITVSPEKHSPLLVSWC